MKIEYKHTYSINQNSRYNYVKIFPNIGFDTTIGNFWVTKNWQGQGKQLRTIKRLENPDQDHFLGKKIL